ncbi:DUF6146 family protein [uncultured Tenacibaculum sp.]|uniref:DUF6146 family protein n=1 Tax=uncultured Tenacibaculum sp. TaxID=174713 RepID=UPI002639D684|nr:DUF6146 family protein [uncultured Tenacibaculum sp.]
MKTSIYYVILGCFMFLLIANCNSTKTINKSTEREEPVVIKNDSLEYEIIILDIGFNAYLQSIARPVGYYSQSYLENRNSFLVPVWNARVNDPIRFNPNIYQNVIDYDANIDYGYDVNYKLFNYFQFAERKYRMVLR